MSEVYQKIQEILSVDDTYKLINLRIPVYLLFFLIRDGCSEIVALFILDDKTMVTAPLILGGDLKISDQNNWGNLSKRLNWRGGPKILGGPMNPNDAMVIVLKDILLCLLGFRFIYIVCVSWYYI